MNREVKVIIPNMREFRVFYSDNEGSTMFFKRDWEEEKTTEQEEQEWSEEDKKRMQSILFSIGYCKDEYSIKKDYSKDIDWLKSLRSRPKSSDNWKPSKGLVWRIWENGACGNSDGFPIAIVKESSTYRLVSCLGAGGEKYIMLSDLEKLPGFDNGESETAKQESSWKPSEEQMEALKYVTKKWEEGQGVACPSSFKYHAITELYEQLKKLR